MTAVASAADRRPIRCDRARATPPVPLRAPAAPLRLCLLLDRPGRALRGGVGYFGGRLVPRDSDRPRLTLWGFVLPS